MTTTKPKGLHAKLAEVMAEAGRIPKNGHYSQGNTQFDYVLVGDAADAIRKELASRGVSMLPESVEVLGEAEHPTRSGGTMTTQTVRTTWRLTDSESGDTAVIQSLGTGADAGDKFSPKAQTNAMKYALLMGFLLSTGDDPEKNDTSDRQSAAVEMTETLELLGRLEKSGVATVGGSDKYKGEWREGPDGHVIGFRLQLPDRDIPQVLVTGEIGEALYLASPAILGESVKLKGYLYDVRLPGRRAYKRLIVGERPTDFIETADVRIPATTEANPEGVMPQREAEPAEAGGYGT